MGSPTVKTAPFDRSGTPPRATVSQEWKDRSGTPPRARSIERPASG